VTAVRQSQSRDEFVAVLSAYLVPVVPENRPSRPVVPTGMTFTRIALLMLVTAAMALPASAAAKSKGLVGEVGPGFSIEVTQGGKDVKTLKPGTYTIKVEDKATIHNFHLKGPGLNKSTTVPFQGDQTWKITLKKGKYTYQCDPHASAGMTGSFTVK
jgi:plastocyanin